MYKITFNILSKMFFIIQYALSNHKRKIQVFYIICRTDQFTTFRSSISTHISGNGEEEPAVRGNGGGRLKKNSKIRMNHNFVL